MRLEARGGTETAAPGANPWRDLVIGVDTLVPVLGGGTRPYINLDNAASTPALRPVVETVEAFLPWYSSVHRGTGFKSLLSTEAYEAARRAVLEFVRGDPAQDVVIFGKNTTEVINVVAARLATGPGEFVLATEMEHHANLLSWSKYHRVEHVAVDARGDVDLEDLRRRLRTHAGQVRLVAVSGASNVTGILPPVHEIAALAHAAGARVLVDAAQLAPHRAVDMRPAGDPAHLDFVTLSAHKMYAPFGTGAVIGPRAFFAQDGAPLIVGGGAVDLVTLEQTYWNTPPDRDEAGSPNVVGAVALGKACHVLSEIGMEAIAAHERVLTRCALAGLNAIPGVRLLGPADAELKQDRLGTLTMDFATAHFQIVSAILGYEYGIGVRAGCFCAHPYVTHLLGVTPAASAEYQRQVRAGDKRDLPGGLRLSFGLYNTEAEVDAALAALREILAGGPHAEYVQDRASGDFRPARPPFELDRYFSF